MAIGTSIRYGTKDSIVKALNNINIEEFKQYIPYPPIEEWQQLFTKNSKKLTKDKKKDLHLISLGILMLKEHYSGLWNPWSLSEENLKKANYSYIIENCYDEIKLNLENHKLNPDNYKNTGPAYRRYWETIWGYHILADFIEYCDNIYYKLEWLSSSDIFVTRTDFYGSKMIIRLDNISIRASRRTKIWPIYIKTTSLSSRRAPDLHFYNALPIDQYEIDNGGHSNKDIAEAITCGRSLPTTNIPIILINAIHPHISNADPCLGGWESRLSRASEYGFGSVFLRHIRGYLGTWSAESPFWNINREYQQSFKFPPIGKRKWIHLSGIDAMYLTSHHSYISQEQYPLLFRILAEEKHEKGYYTSKTIHDYDQYQIGRRMDSKRAAIILNLIHHDKIKEDLPNLLHQNHPADLLGQYIGYYSLRKFRRANYAIRNSSIKLLYSFNGMDMQNMSINMLQKTSACLNILIQKKSDSLRWDNIMDNLTTDRDIANSVEKDGNIIGEIKEIWRERYSTYSKEDCELILLEKAHPFQDRAYYNAIMLGLIEDYSVFKKLIMNWVKASYEKEISKLTKKQKEFSNELNNYSNNNEQSELFSEQVSG